MTTFFDTSVLFSVLNDQEVHHAWSIAQLQACQAQGPIVISDIVYTEFSVAMNTQADVDAAVANLALDRFPRNDAALFRAGKAFKEYKTKNKGPKKRIIADFIVGACAEVSGAALVTTNADDFTTYFPTLQIIEPPKQAPPSARAAPALAAPAEP
jgi:predicted nucleic acid-binding protein